MTAPQSPTGRLVIIGAGGHASDILGLVEHLGRHGHELDVVGLLDDGQPRLDRFRGRGVDVLGSTERIAHVGADNYVIGIGMPMPRRLVAERVDGRLPIVAALVDPTAHLATGVRLGVGTVVLAQACLSPLVASGCHVCISNAAVIGHDSRLGDFASIMPGAMVSGDVSVGRDVLIGTNATVLQGLSIGDGAIVAAGAVVTKDVAPYTTVAGVPARVVASASNGRPTGRLVRTAP